MSGDKKWDITFLQNQRILIAEDVPINRKLMEMLFAVHGIHADFVENGLQLIEKLPSNPYDIILMDLEMPEMDGYEAANVIRQKMGNDIPIIAISGYSEELGMAKCLKVGMNDYITKPIEMEELLFKMYHALKAEPESVPKDNKTAGKPYSNNINLDYIKSCSRGNKKYEQKILQIFLEDIPGQISALRLALENEAKSDAAQLAHKLRSSVAMLGIQECIHLLDQLEGNLMESFNKKEMLNIQNQIELIIYPCFEQITHLLEGEYKDGAIMEV